MADEGFPEEGIYEVEDLQEHKCIDGKDYYLVKWKGYSETSWEPDENIGQELSALKSAARSGAPAGERKRKQDKADRGDKKDKKEKKDKKKRRRESSEEKKRKRDSESESSKEEGKDQGMMPGMMGMPGMMPGMPPGMPMMPGMMPPGFPPDMPGGMMPGMMPGMMMPGDPMGKGKPGAPPMPPGMPPMMMKGKGPGKGPPMPGMPPFPPYDPMGKGLPPPPMGMGCKGGKPKGKFGPGMNREALDMQRFSLERKRRLRDCVGSMHKHLAKEDESTASEEKRKKTEDFQKRINLQLEDHQLPMTVASEVLIADALWLVHLYDLDQGAPDAQLLLNLASLSHASQSRARQLLIRALRSIWPKATQMPAGSAVRLFSALAGMLPAPAYGEPNGMGGGPANWRELITQIYQEHNPSKLADVDGLLTKYRGRERTLYLGICEKYKVPATFELRPPQGMMPPGAPGMPPPPGGMMPGGIPPPPGNSQAQEEQVAKYKELICEVYKEHNPSKLDDVDNLLAKYKGREELVYKGICDKYKVEPKSVSSVKSGDKEKEKDGEADGLKGVDKYKKLITEIYEEHNKEKLGEIDDILKKYEGKEKTLYMAVCHKYKIEPKLPGLKKKDKKNKDKDKAEADGAGADPEAEKAQEEKLNQVRPLIVEIYQAHNPAKLGDVDQLLSKYKGREELLYQGICEKYGVESKLPKPPLLLGAAAAAAADTLAAVAADGAAGEAKPADGNAAVDGSGEANGSPGGAAGSTTQPMPEGPSFAKAKPPGDGPGDRGGPQALKQAYSDLIREVYREHNPSKLDSVDTLINKYKGQEQDLYLTICRKYSVKPKDPEGLGDLEWLNTAEEQLARLLSTLVSVMVLHSSGLRADDAKGLALWEQARPRAPPCSITHSHELGKLTRAQVDQLLRELRGEESARFRKLQDRCVGVQVQAPTSFVPGGEKLEITLACDGSDGNFRPQFNAAVTYLSTALAHAVRNCVESDDEATKRHSWHMPWKCTELQYSMSKAEGGDDEAEPELVRKETGIEYTRGCWAPRKHLPLHNHSLHHSLRGPDVQGRLPEIWRSLASKLWSGVQALAWGDDLPLDSKVVIAVSGGREAQAPSAAMPGGCSAAGPSAAVIITTGTEEELEQAKRAIAPVLNNVLGDLQVNALFLPTTLFMPQQKQAVKLTREDSEESSSDDGLGEESEEVLSDAEATDTYRPLRLTRAQVRDAYLQGLLCLNCDAADHKHQECPFRRKVCWNCHGNHAGNDCPVRCRFCKEKHDFPLLECVKRVCRRVNDWKKSKPAQEQRSVLSNFEQLIIKLEGFEDISLAKHNQEVQSLVKSLAEQSAIFPGDLNDLAMSILDMKPPPKKEPEPVGIPPPPPGPPPKPYVVPKMPKDPPPAMPENKYPWSEKIFLDTLLTKGMYGANILSRIIGRAGMHHRKMETESGARVFFRGLGVSGRDADLAEPIDCRLHIAVKGEVPQQGQAVRRIIKDIVTELDGELTERGESGPALDRPRDVDSHPFSFLLPKNTGPENEEPLKFRFPEEDGQTLNDLLVWLKQARLPLELDSDTQWRTTLQMTPAEPPLPDDAPALAEVIAEAFNKCLKEWHYPCPYWFEEQDLKPTGLWTSLTERDANDEEAPPIILQQGQGVRLTKSAADHFATLMDIPELCKAARPTVINVLTRLRGVVRRMAEDEQLLLYLAYPWAWFADGIGRGLKLPFGREQVHNMLVQLGRVGGKPTESCAAPPFRGFVVEWMPLKAGAGAPGETALPQESPAAPTGMPAPLPTVAPEAQPAPPLQPQPPPPQTAAPPRGFCKYWLPEAAFVSQQDLRELIAGPGGAHFTHVLKKYPSVELRIDGQTSTAAPPAHRLHVSMSSEDYEVFETAAADVLDLVETVCDMVGEELGMSEEQVEGLIREIRAEKYFEAHGIRTPLPPAVRANAAGQAPPVQQDATAAGKPLMPVKSELPEAPVPTVAPSVAPTVAAVPVAPSVKQAQVEQAEEDFEFVDEEVDMDVAPAADGDATDDDARTEASDNLSDLTDDDGQGKQKLMDSLADDI